MAHASAAQFAAAVQRLQEAGGQLVQEFDFEPFAATAALLYQSSFIAERYSGIRAFLDSKGSPGGKGEGVAPEAALAQQRRLVGDERLLPVTRTIISGAGELCMIFSNSCSWMLVRTQCSLHQGSTQSPVNMRHTPSWPAQ